MEFKLNKIDTDLRKQIKDATKEGKIHSKNGVAVNKDKKYNKDDSNFEQQRNSSLAKYNKNNFIVDAKKTEQVEIDVYLEETKENTVEKGIFLDIKK